MAETYTLHVAGLTRELTICKVNDHMDIAAFIMLGDAELTVAAAAELLKKCPDFDILLTAEAKGIPLAHEMSRQSGKPYVCARKGVNTRKHISRQEIHHYRQQSPSLKFLDGEIGKTDFFIAQLVLPATVLAQIAVDTPFGAKSRTIGAPHIHLLGIEFQENFPVFHAHDSYFIRTILTETCFLFHLYPVTEEVGQIRAGNSRSTLATLIIAHT